VTEQAADARLPSEGRLALVQHLDGDRLTHPAGALQHRPIDTTRAPLTEDLVQSVAPQSPGVLLRQLAHPDSLVRQ